jgi:cell division protein FtsA
MPVRVGVPAYVGPLSEVVHTSRFATGIGLLIAGRQRMERAASGRLGRGAIGRVLDRLKSWFQGNF